VTEQIIWRKSSKSGSSGQCVEVASLADGQIGVRDSKNPTGPVLVFTPGEWAAFIAGARAGEFDQVDWPPRNDRYATPGVPPMNRTDGSRTDPTGSQSSWGSRPA
jgi:hypothetical protein